MGRVAVALSAVAVVAALAACGGSTTTSRTTPRPATEAGPSIPAPAPTSGPPPAGLPSCTSRVRTTAGAPIVRPGLCTASGVTIVLAAAGQTVVLRTLTARVVGARLARSVSSQLASRTASGTFLVVTLAIGNRSGAPATFDGLGATQTALQASSSNFREALDAESGADLGSCVERNTTPIAAAGSETCDVVFDVPDAVAQHLRVKGGGLLIVDFGDSIDTV
ncbi:MAG TPA: hypothetical protein VFR49_14420, partial [Solirubrobacteraceae bacterium]|nr:hypothetical protein [Solirubrobacteraceae bacterium]